MAYRSPHDPLPPGRLIAFSDGVFAIAVTLLVFNLHVPEVFSGDVHRQLPAAIMAILPRFITYLESVRARAGPGLGNSACFGVLPILRQKS